MITLYVFGPLWGLPDPSPFVVKAETQLNMAGLPYRTERAGPPAGPKNKLPFINDDGVVVADSTFIRDHIERTYGFDFDAGLDAGQRALAWTIERMLEDQIYWATVFSRWAVDENFAKGPAVFFGDAPAEVKAAGREQVLRSLYGQGYGRHSLAEVADLAGRSFKALSVLLGDKPYLTGDVPCGADATALGTFSAINTPHFDTPVRDALRAHPNLVAYTERMMDRFYPELAAA